MLVLTHRIGGITFRTESDVQFPFLLANRFRQFLDSEAKADVFYRIRGVDSDCLTLPPLSGKELERLSRCVYYPKDGILKVSLLRSPAVRARLHVCLNQPEQVSLELRHSSVVIFDFVRRELDLFYASELREMYVDHHVGPSIFASFLPTFSAAMIHSSGLVLNDAAALFLAPDGGGKTAAVKQSTAGLILCDDQIILRKEGDVLMAHGTPWGLITSGPQQAKVGGFFLLERAQHFELIPLKPVDALEYFWDEHPGYRLFLPRYLRLRAFEILYDACHQAPVYRMRFPKDYVDWDAIDAAMVR